MTDMTNPTTDENFERVCTLEEVPEHMPRRVQYKGRGVLICRDGDELFAVDEVCPHENESMKRGVIFDGEIICPHHQYRFDLKTGRCNQRCAALQTYRLEVIDEEIWLGI